MATGMTDENDSDDAGAVACDGFGLKRPCANCPFLPDGKAIELMPGRLAGIITSLRDDTTIFPCHKTIGTKETSACMGALAYQWTYHKLPIMARIGIALKFLSLKDIEASAILIREEVPDENETE